MALPEGTRVEMINGRFYNMAAPTTIHQRIRDEIFVEFRNYIRQISGTVIARLILNISTVRWNLCMTGGNDRSGY
ncbi:MAG: Uma2 family endonuclease [Lachnospiraceae bacterium]|nr:Uma2 family endonuclease [Lachnospiraceae bacterium]